MIFFRPKSEIMFSLKSETAESKIFIKIDDEKFKVILPEKEMVSIIRLKKFIPGNATTVIPIPQLKLYGLKFQLVDNDSNFKINDFQSSLNISEAEKSLLKFKILKLNDENKIFIDRIYLQNTRFHPLLLSIQFFLAFITAWLFYELIISIKMLNCPNLISLLKRVFIEDKRWIFWLIFVNSFLFLLFWLLGQWPGDMNWDTFTIWRKSQALYLYNIHSFVYILITILLSQFYNSPAIVAISQVILMAGLTAWIFYFAYKNDVSIKWLTFFYVLLVISIPVGMSTILVNTSTLFALLASFWGFYLFRLSFYMKKGKQLLFSNKKLILLAFGFLILPLVLTEIKLRFSKE